MENALIFINGVNGQISLYPNKVVIERKGAMAKMTQGFFKGNKEIYIKQISGIEFKTGNAFTNGYIQFTLAGGNESKKGLLDATHDENTLVFARKENISMAQLKSKVEEFMVSNENTTNIQNIVTPADEIRKYKDLLDSSAISQDEYNAKKKQLLSL